MVYPVRHSIKALATGAADTFMLKSCVRLSFQVETREAGASWNPDAGAAVLDNGTRFRVWAPNCAKVGLVLERGEQEELVRMEAKGGVHQVTVSSDAARTYWFILDGWKKRPDPASLHQPLGVHGPSRVVDPRKFEWHDSGWEGIALEDLIVYELHVGTFTEEGTFDSLARSIGSLKDDVGISAVEVMPIAQFPGSRNWGYDGVFPYSAQESYGGPEGFARLVDRCHSVGLAVILDVVYNHLGPEGNYLADFGPYFSSKYKTPWGYALNYDAAGSDKVRRFAMDNALYWVRDFHVDGLRLDAVHSIFDTSPKHILQELAEEVKAMENEVGRRIHVIAESDLNNPKLVKRIEEGGYGLDAQWADDVHHSIHALLTGERFDYYQDFGSLEDLAKAFTEPFVYDGRYSLFRGMRHGSSPAGVPSKRFVVFDQNHDQVGNRAEGKRLSAIAGIRAAKVAAALVLLSPYIPLLFMGEEYAESAPFYFFTDYGEARIVEATREGRRKELAAQGTKFVDPQDPMTFAASRLHRKLAGSGPNRQMLDYYARLISFRISHPAIRSERSNSEVRALAGNNTIAIRRWSSNDELVLVFVLQDLPAELGGLVKEGRWSLALSSSEGTPATLDSTAVHTFPGLSVSVYKREPSE
jgi:maltooligosyltrehalose trehalohydrolase